MGLKLGSLPLLLADSRLESGCLRCLRACVQPWLAESSFPCMNGCSSGQSLSLGALGWNNRTPFLFHVHPHSDSRPPRPPPPFASHLQHSPLAWNSCNFWDREKPHLFSRRVIFSMQVSVLVFLGKIEKIHGARGIGLQGDCG